MSDAKKIKYLSKSVSFGGKTMTLYSLDGQTWSSRKQELLEIKERQERDKVSFAAIKEENGETRVVAKTKGKVQKPYPVAAKEESEELPFEEVGEELPVVDYSLDDEKPSKTRGRKPKIVPEKTEVVKSVKLKKSAAAPSKKQPVKAKKKALKIVPKARASSKPKVKNQKSKFKAKKKAA